LNRVKMLARTMSAERPAVVVGGDVPQPGGNPVGDRGCRQPPIGVMAARNAIGSGSELPDSPGGLGGNADTGSPVATTQPRARSPSAVAGRIARAARSADRGAHIPGCP
jgi:hypothetical protein